MATGRSKQGKNEQKYTVEKVILLAVQKKHDVINRQHATDNETSVKGQKGLTRGLFL
jgi:hypothetical protein